MLSRFTYQMRHNGVACLALFVALSGTAMAAKPLLTGADIQDESISGADVNESTLSTVPVAATVGGKNSADFAASDQACEAGNVVTGISPSGTIICSATKASTPDATDYCDGVDNDGDGVEGEDDPQVGQATGDGRTLRCIDGSLVPQ